MADTRIIITAAGQQTRWNRHLGVSKHMALVRGEPIIHRTIRLLHDRQQTDIILIAYDEAFGFDGVTVTPPSWSSTLPNTGIGISSRWWSGDSRTVILFGDVFFTEPALDTILAARPQTVLWFGRSHPLKSGSHWKELFALSFMPFAHIFFHTHIRYVRHMRERLGRSNEGGWLLYRSMQGLDLSTDMPRVTTNFVEIDDETTDFDSPADYDEFMATYQPVQPVG